MKLFLSKCLGYGILGLIVLMIIGANSDPEPPKTLEQIRAERNAGIDNALAKGQQQRFLKCNDKSMAYVMSQDTVASQLKSPSTADFPTYPDQVSRVGDCLFKIVSYVDSQNGFGATVRSYWTVKIEHYPHTGSWQVRQLDFDN